MKYSILLVLTLSIFSCRKSDPIIYVPETDYEIVDYLNYYYEGYDGGFEQNDFLVKENGLVIINSKNEYDNKVSHFKLNINEEIDFVNYSLVGFESRTAYYGEFSQYKCSLVKHPDEYLFRIKADLYVSQKKDKTLPLLASRAIYWILIPKVDDKSYVDVISEVHYNARTEFNIEVINGNYTGDLIVEGNSIPAEIVVKNDAGNFPHSIIHCQCSGLQLNIFQRKGISIVIDKVYFDSDILFTQPPYPEGDNNFTVYSGYYNNQTKKLNLSFFNYDDQRLVYELVATKLDEEP